MTHNISKKILEDAVIEILKSVYDPEIPVNIYELGLIYEISIDDELNARILMTLTSPNCPVAESLPVEVKEKLEGLKGLNKVDVDITFDPPWDKEMMSEAALLELGLL